MALYPANLTSPVLLFSSMARLRSTSTLFPYTTLFRSRPPGAAERQRRDDREDNRPVPGPEPDRSEEHTSDSSHVATSYAVFCLKKKTTARVPSDAGAKGGRICPARGVFDTPRGCLSSI